MKYKVGDKVTVRKDLSCDEGVKYFMEDSEYWDDCTGDMVDMGGEQHTISDVYSHGYALESCGWYNWTDEMFESGEQYMELEFFKYLTPWANLFGNGKIKAELLSKNDEYICDCMIQFEESGRNSIWLEDFYTIPILTKPFDGSVIQINHDDIPNKYKLRFSIDNESKFVILDNIKIDTTLNLKISHNKISQQSFFDVLICEGKFGDIVEVK